MQVSFLLSNRLIDKNTKRKNLLIGSPFTILFPDGRKWTNDFYDGYASVISPDGKTCNIFALLAVWNRRQLIEKSKIQTIFSSKEKDVIDKFYDKTVPDDYFAILVEGGDVIVNDALEKIGRLWFATNDRLDKPLKLVEKNDGPYYEYKELPPSKYDPRQGWTEFV